MGVEVGSKITFFVEVQFSCFLGHFISSLSKKNDYDKFQLLKLSIKKFGFYLFCYVQ